MVFERPFRFLNVVSAPFLIVFSMILRRFSNILVCFEQFFTVFKVLGSVFEQFNDFKTLLEMFRMRFAAFCGCRTMFSRCVDVR